MCGLIVLLTLALIARCLIAQKQMSWLSPSSPSERLFPKISVVIPARNEEHDIVASLRSVLNQQGVDLEVIVVNDHSTDRTGTLAEEIAHSNSRITVSMIHHCGPAGLASAMPCNMERRRPPATIWYLLMRTFCMLRRALPRHSPSCNTMPMICSVSLRFG